MCIEVAADDGMHILLDIGMPLYDAEGADYPFGTPQLGAAELLQSGVLLDILELGRVFFPGAALPDDLRVLPDDEPLRFGSLSVTGVSVDHSAPDSRALLIEADEQKLIYSGDLRAHGRTGFRFEKLLADARLQGADWLLLEGTTLGVGSGGHGLRSEQEVEEELVTLARSEPGKLVAVVASGQNLDRLVSCYRAARRSGRLRVIDPYQAFVELKLAPLSSSIPQFLWEGVRVSLAPRQVERLTAAGLMDLVHEMGRSKVSSDDLAADPGKYLMSARGSYGSTKLLTRIGSGNVELVWSMWGGYWKRDGCAMRKWAEREGVPAHFIHNHPEPAWPSVGVLSARLRLAGSTRFRAERPPVAVAWRQARRLQAAALRSHREPSSALPRPRAGRARLRRGRRRRCRGRSSGPWRGPCAPAGTLAPGRARCSGSRSWRVR